MRDHEAHSSGGKSSPVPPAAGPGEEIAGKEKDHRVPQVRRPRCVHSLSRTTTRVRSKTKPKKRMDGLARIHKI